MTDLADLRRRIDYHDLTYNYSDDGAVWRSGQREFEGIIATIKSLSEEDQMVAKQMWNSMVDDKIAKGHGQSFYFNDKWLTR